MSEERNKAARAESPATSAGAARPDITERVLRYFHRNTEAMDSVEGIARFWVHADRDVVEASLADLHARGLLERRLIAGTAFYSLQKESPATRGLQVLEASRTVGPEPAAAPRREARGRILVVDDDAEVRRFLVAALSETGHSVAAAENGDLAIETFRARPCDLVVTDVMMPGTSGLEVLRAVKQISPATEVIVVTAHASLDTAVAALRHGAYDLITKPLPDLETLYRVVDRALEKRRLSAENRLLVESLQARNVELTETVARLAAVNEIGKATAGLLDIDDLYGTLVRLVAQHLRARRVSVLIAQPDSDTMTLVASVGIPEHEAMGRTVRVGEGIAGKVAASQAPLLVKDIEKTELKKLRTGGEYATTSFMITPLMVSYPIRYQRKRVGVINVSDKHSGQPFTEQDLEFLSTLASQMAVAVENARLVKEMESGYLGALVALIQAVENVRPETRGHSARVAGLTASLAEAMGLPRPRIDLLVRAAALHELGRLSARPEKSGQAPARPGRAARTDGRQEPIGEWTPAAVMATEQALGPIASLHGAREIILHSAGRFDTAPIPFGSDRPVIPVESRILSVCEDFARLTAGNSGDPERALRALEALRREAGRKHDPEVVAALCRLAEEGGTR
jgi:response regulator RpfG family c-di-GMP phosphodiesterase